MDAVLINLLAKTSLAIVELYDMILLRIAEMLR